MRGRPTPLVAVLFALGACNMPSTIEQQAPGCTGACDALTGAATFEYIVVGSGAGGGPLAARLAKAGHKVLMLEAGTNGSSIVEGQVPAFHAKSTETPGLAWWYFVEHYRDSLKQVRDSKRTQDGVLYPRGGTLGGSTAVNAMIAVLPQQSDWDNIAAITGDDSWAANNMNAYYDSVRSWLDVNRPDPKLALGDFKILAILAAAVLEFVDSGRPGPALSLFDIQGDFDDLVSLLSADIDQKLLTGDGEGVYSFPLATKNGKRNGTRDLLLDTAAAGFPLTIKMGALVTKVLFDDTVSPPRATGVEYLDGARLYAADLVPDNRASQTSAHASATREVILSAGAFNTPQLLKLSGIGPRAELEPLGIDVRDELPGVGTNLQDRYEVGVVSEVSSDFPLIGKCTWGAPGDACMQSWQNGTGPYTTNGSIANILMRSDPSRAVPDLHIFGVPGVFKGYKPGYSAEGTVDNHHFTWVILKGHTENRAGTVQLRSSNPRERPAIQFNYFDDGDVDQGQDVNDLTAVVNAIEFVRSIGSKTDGIPFFGSFTEVWPGPSVQSRDDIAQWVKDEAWGHHASCSAHIGADSDPTAVLDSNFRVRGAAGLRVVDASVFPQIPGTFIVLPTYMVSEKAADVILADAN